MRTLYIVGVLVVTTSLLVFSQAHSPPSSFLVKVKYMNVDLPRSSPTTCLAVFSDGRFHMEQGSQLQNTAPRVFEGALPNDVFTPLPTILNSEDLKQLQVRETNSFRIVQGEVVWAVIPRTETTQALVSAALVGSPERPAKTFPPALVPFVEWVRSTIKAVGHSKLRPMKKSKPLNCWLTEH